MPLEDRLFNIEQCTRCSQCKRVPYPESKTFSSACPSMDYGNFHAYSAGGKVISAFGYQQKVIDVTPKMVDSVYACTMCGACDTACKSHLGDNVEPFDTLLEFRADLANEGKVPKGLTELVKHLEQEGSPTGKRYDRSRWVEELSAEAINIKDATKEAVEVLLHIGGDNAYDEAQWANLKFIVKLLTAAKVDFGIAYNAESDSGGFAYELGFRKIAKGLAEKWLALVKQSKANVVLAANADDYAAFKNIYPRMAMNLGSVRLLHTTEYIEELFHSGKLSINLESGAKVAYHDACKLGRRSEEFKPWNGKYIRVMNTLAVTDSPREVNYGNEGNYEAPRELLSRVQGLKLVEMERNKQFSYCCGAGCGVKENYPGMAEKAAQHCLDEAAAVGADILITGASNCQRNMAEVAKKNHSPVKVTSLFELLAESIKEDL